MALTTVLVESFECLDGPMELVTIQAALLLSELQGSYAGQVDTDGIGGFHLPNNHTSRFEMEPDLILARLPREWGILPADDPGALAVAMEQECHYGTFRGMVRLVSTAEGPVALAGSAKDYQPKQDRRQCYAMFHIRHPSGP